MKRIVALCAVSVSVGLVASACGSDDSARKAPFAAAGADPGGSPGDQAGGSTAQGGRGGIGGTASAGAGAETGGAGGTLDAEPGAGAGGAVGGDAGEPSVGGASGGEANGGEGGGGSVSPIGNVVYATFGTKLVWLEPETGQLHEVGDMRSAQGDVTYAEVVLAYGDVPGEARIVTPRYEATANQPSPQLGKLDLCTGVVSELATLTLTVGTLTALEGLAMHPNGTWYVSTGTFPPGPTQYLTNKLGSLSLGTGAITSLAGTVDTLQNDMDSMVFVGTTLYGIDVATGTSQLELVTADLTTGLVSSIATPTYAGSTAVPLRLAYDATRSKAYAWRSSDRNLLEMSLANGTVTAVGETHPANVYPGEVVQGFVVAPACP